MASTWNEWRRDHAGTYADYENYLSKPAPGPEHPWTVIGFWWEDEPVVTAVLAGELVLESNYSDVLDDDSEGFRGPWAASAVAADPDTAEAMAVEEMLATLHRDDEEQEKEDNA